MGSKITDKEALAYFWLRIKEKLSGKADVGHKHSYNDLDNKPTIPTMPTALSQLSQDSTHRVVTDTEKASWNAKADKTQAIFYIEGEGTTAGTWLGSHDGITSYYDGLTIAYKVNVAGASGLTLNINNLGAVLVVRNVNTAVTTHYGVNSVVILTYTEDDGTAYWKVSDYDSDTKTRSSNKVDAKMFIIGASSQSTSGQTTYSNKNCYIGADNCLYSNGAKVSTTDTTYDVATTSADGLMSSADKSKLDGLSKVATSGSYNDLSNKPTIPTVPSSLPANGGNADTVDGYHIRTGTSGAAGYITFVV